MQAVDKNRLGKTRGPKGGESNNVAFFSLDYCKFQQIEHSRGLNLEQSWGK